MPQRINLTGQQFGRLTVLWMHGPGWFCICKCGRTGIKEASLLLASAQSCGCLRIEKLRRLGPLKVTHGQAKQGQLSREYRAWRGVKVRCFNQKHKSFRHYGARGITMAPEWRNDFQAFFDHIGPCPPGLTLDRIDNERGYEPGNVRWATWKEQNNNRRKARRRQT